MKKKIKIVNNGNIKKLKTKVSWSKEEFEKIRESKEYKLYLDEVSKLNNQEFLMFFISDTMNSEIPKLYDEVELMERKIKELSNTDLETIYYLLEQNPEHAPLIYEELENRNLLIEKIDKEGNKYYELKDYYSAEERAQKYDEIMEFDYMLSIIQPVLSEDKYKKIMQKIENNLIKTICKLEKENDLECCKLVSKLNQTENLQDYDGALNYEEIFYDNEQRPDKELIQLYSQRCKYEIIKYLEKRIISMPKGYVAMIDISNEDGIFNDIVEIRLEDERLDVKEKNSDGAEH